MNAPESMITHQADFTLCRWLRSGVHLVTFGWYINCLGHKWGILGQPSYCSLVLSGLLEIFTKHSPRVRSWFGCKFTRGMGDLDFFWIPDRDAKHATLRFTSAKFIQAGLKRMGSWVGVRPPDPPVPACISCHTGRPTTPSGPPSLVMIKLYLNKQN